MLYALATMLLGRAAECRRIGDLIVEARDGRSSALVLAGKAGVGKTALAEWAVEQAADATVLRTRGLDAESELLFSGLYDLVTPIMGHLDAIPLPQADALRGALALGPPVAADHFAFCAATLSLLAAAAERGPVLVVIDDAQWLDASSREALLFVARRLNAEGVERCSLSETIAPKASSGSDCQSWSSLASHNERLFNS